MSSGEYFDRDYFTKYGVKGGYKEDSFDLENKFHAELAAMWREGLGLRPGQKVLDLGCARGNVVYWLVQEGIDAYGCDISEWCIENSHIADRTKQADIAENIPWPDRSFDYVVCRDVLEHIPEDKIDTTIKEIYRVLAWNGVAALAPRTNRAGKEDKKRASEAADPSHVLIRTPVWWVDRIVDVAPRFSWDPRATLEMSCSPLAFLNDWDILVFTKYETRHEMRLWLD